MKLTAEGDSLWSRTYAYNGALPIPDYVWGITDTPEGGFLFAGFTSAFNTDSTTLTQTAWVVRTDSLGNACYIPDGCEWAVGTEPAPPLGSEGGSYSVVVYPNPAQNTLHFSLTNSLTPLSEGWEVTLYTPAGQQVLHSSASLVGTQAMATHTVQVGHLPADMYFYTVQSGGTVLARGKVAVVR